MNPSVNKRQKERQRQERQKEKAERKKLRQEEKRARAPGPDGVDPDIAGIVPGPQPRSEEEPATTAHLGAGARSRVALPSEEGGLMAEGTIKRLTDKGFGFIETSPGKDIFFHMSAVQGVRFEDLRQGQRVSFTEGMGPKGPKAENVKPI
jgi:CspA family cold shock protein